MVQRQLILLTSSNPSSTTMRFTSIAFSEVTGGRSFPFWMNSNNLGDPLTFHLSHYQVKISMCPAPLQFLIIYPIWCEHSISTASQSRRHGGRLLFMFTSAMVIFQDSSFLYSKTRADLHPNPKHNLSVLRVRDHLHQLKVLYEAYW